MVKVQPQKYTVLIAFLYCDIYRLFSYNVKVEEEGGINKSATQCDYRGRWYYGKQVDLNQTHFQPLCCVSKVGDETEQRYYTLSTLNIATKGHYKFCCGNCTDDIMRYVTLT